MVDIRVSPPREGNRGGLEEFKWDSVKTQNFRDRECYLGHSVRIGVMGKGGDFFKNDWWMRNKEKYDNVNNEEFLIVKKYEEEIMKEALGIKAKKLMLQKQTINLSKMKEIVQSLQAEVDTNNILETHKEQDQDKKKKKKNKEKKRPKNKKHKFEDHKAKKKDKEKKIHKMKENHKDVRVIHRQSHNEWKNYSESYGGSQYNSLTRRRIKNRQEL